MHNHQFLIRRNSGFSLVEMMIAITIGLAVIAALVGVLASNSRNSKTTENSSELQENGRYALSHLQRELRHADYRGYTWVAPEATTIAATTECLVAGAAAGSFVNHLSQGVWGSNDSNPFAANCLQAGSYQRGDILVVRRVGSANLTSPTALVAGNVYFRSTFTKGQMFVAPASAVAATGAPQNADNTAFGVPLADFLVNQYVYYIGKGDCVGGGDVSYPALCRLSLLGTTFTPELVVSGIEQMQVQYGLMPPNVGTTQWMDANGVLSDADWEHVGAVRLWILARNARTEPDPGFQDSNAYRMGDITYGPMNDRYRRQVFTTVVQLRNFHE
jgi:type IV pilus assembly protein PilW